MKMVRYGNIGRTCGSVRRRLTAPARLVTAWSDSCRDNMPNRQRFGGPREVAPVAASVRLPGHGQDGRPNSKVTAFRIVRANKPTDAHGLEPKWQRSRGYLGVCEPTDKEAAGVMAGAKPSVSSSRNTVNPLLSSWRGRRTARSADRAAGKGSWKKPKPPCNRVDRDRPGPPRKRADFQRVINDEKVCRTTA
jgi:hypothetical protein